MSGAPDCDLIIVGCGPAGMAAGLLADRAGLSVTMLDDQSEAGGQVYRQVGSNGANREEFAFLGEDYWQGAALAEALDESGVSRRFESRVWHITRENEVLYSRRGRSVQLIGRFVLLATGAMERPMPIPGWTLPGVMTAGAAQTLLKASASGADGAVFIGSGPLLYLTVRQYLLAGFQVGAVLDTAPAMPPLRVLARLFPALLQADMLLKGWRWRREIMARTRYLAGVCGISLHGADRVRQVRFADAEGRTHNLAAEHVFLHQGVIPNINLGMAMGLVHRWDSNQLCWRPETDRYGETSQKGVFVAGDGGGIAGAAAAVTSGRIAAARISWKAGLRRAELPLLPRLRHRLQRACRPFLDSMYRPPEDWMLPEDGNTTVCRCEGLTRTEVESAIAMGVAGPNQLKSYCRAGMGRCQARMCGLTVQRLIAESRNVPVGEVGYFRLRPPVRPVTVGELSMLASDGGQEE